MSQWFDPIMLALAQRSTPCRIFFRDDDAGWDDEALFALLERFRKHQLAIDLALIPAALTAPLATALTHRLCSHKAPVGIHQHGYAHQNHEREARKCEFGESRAYAAQRADIEAGHAIINAAFGSLAGRIFTPPWNRCSADTVRALTELGFAALSRDLGARPLEHGALVHIPVAVDWSKMRRPGSSPDALAQRISACIAESDQCGIMLHHAAMDIADLSLLDTLLPLLRAHPLAQCVSMGECLKQPDSGQPDTPRACIGLAATQGN